jgi:dihydrofolate reductase
MKITVTNHVTLDGVMQAPAAADEDPQGGFHLGGWAAGDNDAVMGEEMAKGMSRGGAMLLGRRTYEHFFAFWPKQKNNPFTDVLNGTTKFIASRTLTEPLAWQNSKLLPGDAAEAVAKMKQNGGPDLAVLGSGDLIDSLLKRNLIDEFLLMFHPVVLGQGKKLFRDGVPHATLKLVDSKVTTKGVLIATYRPRQ